MQAQVQASSAAKAAGAQGASGVAGSSPDSGGSTGLDREEFAKQLDELKQQVFSESERANAALKELELEQETGHKLRERYGKVCAQLRESVEAGMQAPSLASAQAALKQELQEAKEQAASSAASYDEAKSMFMDMRSRTEELEAELEAVNRELAKAREDAERASQAEDDEDSASEVTISLLRKELAQANGALSDKDLSF